MDGEGQVSRLAGLSWSWKTHSSALEDNAQLQRLTGHSLSPGLSISSFIPGNIAPFLFKPHPGNLLGFGLRVQGCSPCLPSVYPRGIQESLLTPSDPEGPAFTFPFPDCSVMLSNIPRPTCSAAVLCIHSTTAQSLYFEIISFPIPTNLLPWWMSPCGR